MPADPSRPRKRPTAGAGGPPERPLVTLRGRLECRRMGRGTASDHLSWVITDAAHGPLLLKPLDANPFELGPAPAPEGCEIEAEGYLLEGELRYLRLRRL